MMAMWNRCAICGKSIPVGELCYGVKNWRGDPIGGDTICRDCLVPENAPTLTPPNEWVSVENAVPDPGERVLATDGTFVGEAYRTSANTWYRHTGFPWRDCLQSIVTLWMPLPTADKDNHVPAKAPNEPLTLEQLREMDGEPVWVEDVRHWALIDIGKGGQWDGVPFAIWAENGARFCYNILDRNLLCYRRPPDGL